MNDDPICKNEKCKHPRSAHNATVSDKEGTARVEFTGPPGRGGNIHTGLATSESACSYSKCPCREFQG